MYNKKEHFFFWIPKNNPVSFRIHKKDTQRTCFLDSNSSIPNEVKKSSVDLKADKRKTKTCGWNCHCMKMSNATILLKNPGNENLLPKIFKLWFWVGTNQTQGVHVLKTTQPFFLIWCKMKVKWFIASNWSTNTWSKYFVPMSRNVTPSRPTWTSFWRYLLDLVLKRVTRVSNCMKLSNFWISGCFTLTPTRSSTHENQDNLTYPFGNYLRDFTNETQKGKRFHPRNCGSRSQKLRLKHSSTTSGMQSHMIYF